LFWHKIIILLTGSIITLTLCIALITWYFLNHAGKEIGLSSRKIFSEQTEAFIGKLVKGQAATLDVQLLHAKATAVYGANFIREYMSHHNTGDIPLEKLLFTLYTQADYSTNIYFTSSDGQLRVTSPVQGKNLTLPQNFNITRESFFPKPENFKQQFGEICWSKVHVNPLTVSFDLVVDAVAPVRHEDKIYGYIGVSVSLTRLTAQFNQYQPIRGSYSFMIDTQYQMIGAPPHARVELSPFNFSLSSRGIIDLNNTGNAELDRTLQKMVLGESSLSELKINNDLKYLAYHPLKNINWRLGLVVPVKMATAASKQLTEVVESGTRKALKGMLYWAGGLLILAIIGGIMLARQITMPIRDMSSVAKEIAAGNFKERVKISGRDEMGRLGFAFNCMADKIQVMINDLNNINQELNLSNKELIEEIFERQQAEDELKESEERFRSLTESSPDIIFTLEHDGLIAYLNPVFEKILGYKREEAIGKSFTDFVKPEESKMYNQIFKKINNKKDIVRDAFMTLILKNGESRLFSLSGAPHVYSKGERTGMVGICKDITEQRQLEMQLRQSHKMEALGTLAGGIAHDFNNILAAILGYTELAMMKIMEDMPVKSNLDNVLKAINRAKNLVGQILTFSRQTEHEKEPLQVSLIVKEALKLLRASIPATIDIQQDIDIESDMVMADPTQIHQVMMNLCTNASYAMREKGGILEVKLSNVYIDAETVTQQLSHLKPGHYLRLSVGDTGHGIHSSIIQRIFDPFFTTKKIGEGTGMGLSVVHGIASSHGGTVTVESEPGIGSVFHVFFPLMDYKPESSDADPNISELLLMGNERILFVDDEKELGGAFKGMLEHLGYNVTFMSSSIDALTLLFEQPDGFDLVITDQTMPHLTGSELAKEFRRIRPNISFILCTGSSEHMTRDEAMTLGFKEYFMKPVAIQEIAGAIRRILDERIKSPF